MRSTKGSRRERELLELLSTQGFVVHRVAGSGLQREAVCDLVAVKNGCAYFIEVKSRKKYYYSKEDFGQLRALIKIANACKAKPLLAVRLNHRNWLFFDLNKEIPERVV